MSIALGAFLLEGILRIDGRDVTCEVDALPCSHPSHLSESVQSFVTMVEMASRTVTDIKMVNHHRELRAGPALMARGIWADISMFVPVGPTNTLI